MINKVTIVGNVGADPEIKSISSGTKVTNLSVATSMKYKDKNGDQVEKTEWHRIVCWGRLAEICEEYISKGSRVYVEGRLETRKWQASDGTDRYTTEIVASQVLSLSRSASAGGTAHPPTISAPVDDAPF